MDTALPLPPARRLVAGVMSGTSLDGVDVALAWLEGTGRDLKLDPAGTFFHPYSNALKDVLLQQSVPETSDVLTLTLLNALLPQVYAEAILLALDAAQIPPETLDLVGVHGQTVHHVPEPRVVAGYPVRATLQIGCPSTLAQLLGVPVVGQFRVADMALGGQGAPLVPYFDFVRFSSADETRGLLNLGGIANLTALPRGCEASDVYAFDTGPANMLIDGLVQRLFGVPYDAEGERAVRGTVDEEILAGWLDDAYLHQPPPKSTGREKYTSGFVQHVMDQFGLHDGDTSQRAYDALATATAFTARSVYDAYQRFVEPQHPLDVLIVSGGGVRNRTLMHGLAHLFAPIPVRSIEVYGVDSDSKEALCFAVLAHEWVNGTPTGMPGVTGAPRAVRQGMYCIP